MSESYSMVEARSHFPELLDKAQDGERILITRYGKPAAVLVRIPAAGEETKTLHLPCGGSVTLNLDFYPLQLGPRVRELVFDVIEAFRKLDSALGHDTTETKGEQQ